MYIIPYLDKEYTSELKAISKLTQIGFDIILIYNIMYENYAFCTSIIIRETDGSLTLGRNLDYSFQHDLT